MALDTWLAFFLASWIISLSPGAGAIASMSSGLQYGFLRGYWNAIGLQIGLAMQIAVVAGGLGAILAASSTAFYAIKWFGVAYLVYLAVKQWRALPMDMTDDAAVRPIGKPMAMMFRGFLVNASNPKALVFMLAVLPILTVARNRSVSAWFPVLLLAYPLVEIAFTVYRRKALRGADTHLPDAAHLHQLIFRRVVRWALGRTDAESRTLRNAMTAPYLWVLSSLAVAPAAIWYERTEVLASLFGLFVISYVWLYFRIVRLKVPRWMVRWKP